MFMAFIGLAPLAYMLGLVLAEYVARCEVRAREKAEIARYEEHCRTFHPLLNKMLLDNARARAMYLQPSRR